MAKAKKDGGIVETIKTVVYALLIAGVFRTLFFQPFWIPSESMKDTLLIGDCGRTDLPSGDAGRLYDSITTRLFTLPADSVVSLQACPARR